MFCIKLSVLCCFVIPNIFSMFCKLTFSYSKKVLLFFINQDLILVLDTKNSSLTLKLGESLVFVRSKTKG